MIIEKDLKHGPQQLSLVALKCICKSAIPVDRYTQPKEPSLYLHLPPEVKMEGPAEKMFDHARALTSDEIRGIIKAVC